MYMFELLDSPNDLSSVLRTCRSFHNYAIRALHRSIVWKQPAASAHNLPFWNDEAEVLLNNVQSLDLHISTLPDRAPGQFVDLGGWQFTRLDTNPHFQYPEGPWVEEQHVSCDGVGLEEKRAPGGAGRDGGFLLGVKVR